MEHVSVPEPSDLCQPVPVAAVGVNPVGTVSLTVTVLVVGPTSVPEPFETVIVYVSLGSLWLKLPVCDFVTVRRGSWTIVVGSVVELHGVPAQPPPDTDAELVTEDAA